MIAHFIEGRVWKYGDNINTDVIFPGKYTYTVHDPAEMAKIALVGLDSEFAKRVKKNDIIVAGKNFGCGSSREQAAFCLKYAGVGAVIAKSFSRLFFRNSLNTALPAIESKDLFDLVKNGDVLKIDFQKGIIEINNKEITFAPLPKEILKIFEAGGLVEYVRRFYVKI